MARPQTEDFIPSPSESYAETGLQTGNNPEQIEQDTPTASNGAPTPSSDSFATQNRNARDVTDPVTHIPITIYDATDQELERIPPPPATPQEQPPEQRERKTDSDRRHDEMNRLVEAETDGRWVDVEERMQQSRLRAAVIAGAAAAGAAGVMNFWAAVMPGWWWVRIIWTVVGCVLLGGAAGGAVWMFAEGGDGRVDTDTLMQAEVGCADSLCCRMGS